MKHYRIVDLEDSDDQVQKFLSNPLGTVLQQEGLANDVKFHISAERREQNKDVSEFVPIYVICGDIVAWSIFWNRDKIIRDGKLSHLFINNCLITENSTAAEMDFNPSQLEDRSLTYIQATVGGKENKFYTYISIYMP